MKRGDYIKTTQRSVGVQQSNFADPDNPRGWYNFLHGDRGVVLLVTEAKVLVAWDTPHPASPIGWVPTKWCQVLDEQPPAHVRRLIDLDDDGEWVRND